MQTWTFENDRGLARLSAVRSPHLSAMGVRMLRRTIQLTMRVVLRTYERFDVVGRENLPLTRSFIMIANHSSHLDAVCLLSSLPLGRVDHAYPVAAADYFFANRLRSALSIISVNGLPLDRQNGADGLGLCRELLIDPRTVLIVFPEGTRSCTGTLGRFRSGVARLAAGTLTPVVPCYLSGAFEAWPKSRLLPRPGRLRLRIGRPRIFPDVSPQDREAVARVSLQLGDDVAALGRSERALTYAT